MKERNATIIGFLAVVMWGVMPPLAAWLGNVPSFQVNAIGFTIASIVIFSYWKFKGENLKAKINMPFNIWLLGIFGIFGFHFFYFFAYRNAPAMNVMLIVNLWPLLTVLFAAFILKEKLHWWHILGCAMGFAGVIYITQSKGGAEFSDEHIKGYIQALICALVWAIYSVLTRKNSNKISSDAIGGFCLATAILSWILHLLTETSVELSLSQSIALFLMGIGPVGLAFFVWDYGVRHGNVRTLGVLAYAGPLIGATLLLLLGISEFNQQIAIAGILILGGALIGCFGGMLGSAVKNIKT